MELMIFIYIFLKNRFRRILAELRLQGEACNVVTLCRLREECLRAAGFADLFARVKADETAAALTLLPAVLRHVDKLNSPAGRMRRALMGVRGVGSVSGHQFLARRINCGVCTSAYARNSRDKIFLMHGLSRRAS
jgi:hypothetical protein